MQWKVNHGGVTEKQKLWSRRLSSWACCLLLEQRKQKKKKINGTSWTAGSSLCKTLEAMEIKVPCFCAPLKPFVVLVQYPGLWLADLLHFNTPVTA